MNHDMEDVKKVIEKVRRKRLTQKLKKNDALIEN